MSYGSDFVLTLFTNDVELARRADPNPGRSTHPTSFPPARAVAPPPRLTEPWFC